MAKSILADSREQSTFIPSQSLYQEDLNAIANAAKNIAESFDSDSAIGQGYSNLAKAATATCKLLACAQKTSNSIWSK